MAFVFEEEDEEGKEESGAWEVNEEPSLDKEKNEDNDNDNDNNNTQSESDNKNNDSTIMSIDEWASGAKEEFVVVCATCEEDQCLFVQNRESLFAYDEAEHLLGDGEDLPTNNIKRKQLYRQLTLMLNGGPFGADVRRELPACCAAGIRQMLPLETFMGFEAE